MIELKPIYMLNIRKYALLEHIYVQVLVTKILDEQKIKLSNINYLILTSKYLKEYKEAIKSLKKNKKLA